MGAGLVGKLSIDTTSQRSIDSRDELKAGRKSHIGTSNVLGRGDRDFRVPRVGVGWEVPGHHA